VAEKSLYRRHRPQAFDEVVGQEHVVRTLRNAVERDRVHHAYLFVGSRGTGKTSIAKILARSLNCVDGPTVSPCGQCESCRTIAAGSSLDVIEMDAASNRSVDDIRDLRERVGYVPATGHWKVYILDEAHMLTREAWNAFLKTLEEPPPNTVFVLATTEPHKVMPTIVDRCQRFDFQRPSLEQIAEVIRRVAAAEQIEIADGAVAAIARGATGSFRDALGTLDQLVSYGGKRLETEDVLAVLGVAEAEVILAAAEAIASQDGRAAFEAAESLAGSGRDASQFGRDLLAHLRQLLVIRTVGEVPDAFSVTAAEPEGLHAQAEAFTDLALARAIDSIAAALAAIREGDEARMTMELALLRAARPQLDPSREALAQRLERLERALEGGIAPDPHRTHTGEDRTADAAKPGQDDAGSDPESSDPEPRDPSTEALDLERLTTVWPALVDQLRESGSEVLSHVLSAARPVAVDMEGAVLKVGFPAGAAFNKRKAEAAEARDRLADAVRTLVGERLRPVFVLLEGEEYESAAPGEPSLSEDELLEHLMTEFDAEEVADAEPGGDQEEAA
jgi:DNA polymerase-3 subunit gamma/tau